MIRPITSEDLRDCARLFVKVFSEWPYEGIVGRHPSAPLSQSILEVRSRSLPRRSRQR